METDIYENIHRINYLTSELDALYHQAALKLGLTDSAMCVLYSLHEGGGSCFLSDIYKQFGVSKQTINSALRRLEEDGAVYLEVHRGKSKTVRLTKKGEDLVSKTVVRLCDAEAKAFELWSEEEKSEHVRLTEKYVESFRRQVQSI